jgi:hypothetical protein
MKMDFKSFYSLKRILSHRCISSLYKQVFCALKKRNDGFCRPVKNSAETEFTDIHGGWVSNFGDTLGAGIAASRVRGLATSSLILATYFCVQVKYRGNMVCL